MGDTHHRPHGVAHLPGAFVGLAVYDPDAPTATEADE